MILGIMYCNLNELRFIGCYPELFSRNIQVFINFTVFLHETKRTHFKVFHLSFVILNYILFYKNSYRYNMHYYIYNIEVYVD